jgi:sulfur carrier protein
MERMINVNGVPLIWHDGMTVAEILKIRNYIFRMIAVQVNGDLVRRGTYDTVVVPDDADVQVIHMISGG